MNISKHRITKTIINKLIRIDFIWNTFFKKILIIANHIEKSKQIIDSGINIEKFINDNFPDLKVKNGLFKGMKYPNKSSAGSSLPPKLLGSYEKELEPTFEEICRKNYSEIIDIGCAEGYYAIGLALRINTAKIFAYDINERAISLCSSMATLNNVNKRVKTQKIDACDNPLETLILTEKALIIVDCEGCEKNIFNKNIVNKLKMHDVLIEIHDLIDIEISEHIYDLFKSTHDIKIINSVDDIKKAQTYIFPELDAYDLKAKKQILAERRSSSMEWFFITPRLE